MKTFLIALVAVIYLVLVCSLVGAAHKPAQAPRPPQAPPAQDCGCSVTGICTCGPNCPCPTCPVHHPASPVGTASVVPPLPAGTVNDPSNPWRYDAQQNTFWRHAAQPQMFQPAFQPAFALQPMMFGGGMSFGGGCAGGFCGGGR